jgi:hypothetical protein
MLMMMRRPEFLMIRRPELNLMMRRPCAALRCPALPCAALRCPALPCAALRCPAPPYKRWSIGLYITTYMFQNM